MIPKVYGWLAGLAALLILIGVIYGKGRIDANHKQELAQLTETLELTKSTLATEKVARQNDTILATEAAKRQNVLKLKIGNLNDYVETLEVTGAVCLDGTDTERLRDLW
ncbi:hypothetical protein NKH33_09585 [Mesorhizobium sp. M1182]|uniref:hypothetical protein n=1 Tax=unclassified Mesorhizobium TaxID=325217 RepID=UPI003335122F